MLSYITLYVPIGVLPIQFDMNYGCVKQSYDCKFTVGANVNEEGLRRKVRKHPTFRMIRQSQSTYSQRIIKGFSNK